MHRARADVSWSGNRLLGGALKALSSTLSDALRQTACLSRIQQDAPSSGDIAVSLRRCKTPHESASGAVQAYEKNGDALAALDRRRLRAVVRRLARPVV